MKDREDQYGNPEDSFQMIADLWSSYLEENITSVDVANMMILLKIARNKSNPSHTDNYVDMCGYSALGYELQSKNKDHISDKIKYLNKVSDLYPDFTFGFGKDPIDGADSIIVKSKDVIYPPLPYDVFTKYFPIDPTNPFVYDELAELIARTLKKR